MKELEEIINNIHFKILRLRTIERIIEQESFKKQLADSDDKEIVLKFILLEDKESLERWIKSQQDYSSMTIEDLRRIGRKYGINYYSRLKKSVLLQEILQYERVKYNERTRTII